MIINDPVFRRERLIGKPVRSLQTMLRVLAEADSRLPSVIPDGIYGQNTKNAVSAFQRRNGLPVTGVADDKTWQEISNAFRDALVLVGPAAPIYVVLQPNQVIRRGEQNDHVWLVQAMLAVIAKAFPSFRAPDHSGILDPMTSAQISNLQRTSGLPETGNIDKRTWLHLVRLYDLAAGDGTK